MHQPVVKMQKVQPKTQRPKINSSKETGDMYCITASYRLKGGEAHRARLRRRRRHQHTQVLRDRVGRGGFLCRYEIVVKFVSKVSGQLCDSRK